MEGEGIIKSCSGCSFAGRDETKIRGKGQAKSHKYTVFK